MRHHLAFAALLLPLAGCVVPPAAPPPPPYGYAPPPPAPYPPEFAYPGFAYIEGSPVYVVGGVTWPLVFWGGGWGYWDGYHRWHAAPGPVGRHLGARFPGGAGFHPYGGGPWGRPMGFRGQGAYGPPAGGRPGMGPGGRPAAGRSAPVRHREQGH
jgi:hypothetical protein